MPSPRRHTPRTGHPPSDAVSPPQPASTTHALNVRHVQVLRHLTPASKFYWPHAFDSSNQSHQLAITTIEPMIVLLHRPTAALMVEREP